MSDLGSSDKRIMSSHHDVSVSFENGEKVLRFDGVKQTAIRLGETVDGSQDVYKIAARLPRLLRLVPKNVLCIGLGGGVVLHHLFDEDPEMSIRVYELDPAIVDLAKAEFALPKNAGLSVELGDGRQLLSRTEDLFDYIFVDAYFVSGMPSAFITKEFFELLHQRSSSSGVAGYNIVANPTGDAFARFASTALSVFDDMVVVAANNDCGFSRTNIAVLFGKQSFDSEYLARLRSHAWGGLQGKPSVYTRGELQDEWTAAPELFTDASVTAMPFFLTSEESPSLRHKGES